MKTRGRKRSVEATDDASVAKSQRKYKKGGLKGRKQTAAKTQRSDIRVVVEPLIKDINRKSISTDSEEMMFVPEVREEIETCSSRIANENYDKDVDVERFENLEMGRESSNDDSIKDKDSGKTGNQEQVKPDSSKDYVLSVVIQKLTELVKSSELCSSSQGASKSECSSGANTPPRAPESKKRSKGKKKIRSQLLKCPNCPCLFAVKKRDLRRKSDILCLCCEKLRMAKMEASKTPVEEEIVRSDAQVVPLESWKVVCEICSQWVSDYSKLLFHLASHPGVQIFKCKLCEFVTTVKEKIEKHQDEHCPTKKDNKFVCSLCKFATSELSSMQAHLKQHDQEKTLVLKCSECGFSCCSISVFRNHMINHLQSSGVKKGPKVQAGVKEVQGETELFKCSVCNYMCDKLSTLKCHAWRHSGDQSCFYPVEDEESEHKTKIPEADEQQDVTGATVEKDKESEIDVIPNNQEKTLTQSEKDPKKKQSKEDYSRLAIGCCNPDGESCCSDERREGQSECNCRSINVSQAQRPVLKIIFDRISSKLSSPREGQDEASQKVNDYENENTQEAYELVKLSKQSSSAPQKYQNDEETVENVLAECSELISGLCETKKNENKEGLHCLGGSQGDGVKIVQCQEKEDSSPWVPVQERSHGGVDSDAKGIPAVSESGKTGVHAEDAVDVFHDKPNKNENEMVIVVEAADILNDAGSIVEVTTSDDLPEVNQKNVEKALKRLLSASENEEALLQASSEDDTSGISDLLLNVVEDLVKKPSSPKKRKRSESADQKSEKAEDVVDVAEILKCPFCMHSCPSYKNLKEHLLEHCQESMSHKCKMCSAVFKSDLLLNEHLKCHSGDVQDARQLGAVASGNLCQVPKGPSRLPPTNRTCMTCERRFRTKAALYLHERDCKIKKVHSCRECDFVASSREEINQHIASNHKKPYKCALCNYTSATPSGIKNHMKFHAVDKPYKCHLCDFSGAYPQSLRSHLKTHLNTDVPPEVNYEQFKCKFCGHISGHLPSMKSHMWRHAQEPGFKYDNIDEIIEEMRIDNDGGIRKRLKQLQTNVHFLHLPEVMSAPPSSRKGSQSEIVKVTPGTLQIPGGASKIMINTGSYGITATSPATLGPLQPAGLPSANVPTASSGPATCIVIFQCSHCSFHSNNEGELLNHLKIHLTNPITA